MVDNTVMRHYTEEENDAFVEENKDMFSALQEMGWDLPDDPMIRELSLQLYRQMEDEHKQAVVLASRTHGRKAMSWTDGKSEWEIPLDPLKVREQREDLMSSCYQQNVTTEFLEDVKRRWEEALFSSVTEDFIVIGDVRAKNFVKISPVDEKDFSSDCSSFGKKNLTHDIWHHVDIGKIDGVRPKINGERFTFTRCKGVFLLRGFCDYEVPKNFQPQLVEYYGGRYYVLFPHISKTLTYTVKRKGQEMVLLFEPHPVLSVKQYLDSYECYCSHKYDGIMVYLGNVEYRTKWKPTVETIVNNSVWEVSLDVSGLVLERPRPGKPVVKFENVKGFLRSQMSSQVLVTKLRTESPKNVVTVQIKKNVVMGAKCFFIDFEKKLVFIREPGKELDLIGGKIEFGETPSQALIREVREETGAIMKEDDFLFLGVSVEEGTKTEWRSYVFLGVAPKKIVFCPHVERYSFDWTFEYLKNSALGRPWQAWLERHFAFAHEKFAGLHEMLACACLYWDLPKTMHPKIEQFSIRDDVYDLISDRYSLRAKELLEKKGLAEFLKLGLPLPNKLRMKLGINMNKITSTNQNERKDIWHLLLSTPKDRFEIRTIIRQLGHDWSDGHIGMILHEAISKGEIYKKNMQYFVND
jgi:ADP-ribose pyrophosphatase YjhB (NUDIX family)